MCLFASFASLRLLFLLGLAHCEMGTLSMRFPEVFLIGRGEVLLGGRPLCANPSLSKKIRRTRIPTQHLLLFLYLFAIHRSTFVGLAHVIFMFERGMHGVGDFLLIEMGELVHFGDTFGIEFGRLVGVEVVADVDIDVLRVRVQHTTIIGC